MLKLFSLVFTFFLVGCSAVPDKNEDRISTLIKESEDNNHLAQAKLSLLYMEGVSVEQNLGKAFELLKKSSEDIYAINKVYKQASSENNAAAEYGLYAMWSEGWGVPRNVKIASKHLQKSAELDFPRAMYVLGLNYRANIYGVKEDLEKSYYWLHKAGEHGIDVKRHLEYNKRLNRTPQ